MRTGVSGPPLPYVLGYCHDMRFFWLQAFLFFSLKKNVFFGVVLLSFFSSFRISYLHQHPFAFLLHSTNSSGLNLFHGVFLFIIGLFFKRTLFPFFLHHIKHISSSSPSPLCNFLPLYNTNMPASGVLLIS